MADDIFSQLIELFNQPGPVNWKLAREVAVQLAGDREPVDPWLADEYIELGRLAQLRIQATTHLRAPDSLDVVPTDRHDWATQRLQAFSYLVEPLASQYDGVGGGSDPMSQLLKPLGPALLGMQIGSTIGFLSHRAIGQFDIGLPANPDGARYVIVDNVEDFASDYQLEPRQVRLWVALRNGVHDAAFAGPWLRQYIIDLVEEHLAGVTFDTSHLMETLQNLSDPSNFQQVMSDADGLSAFLSPTSTSEAQAKARAAIGFVSGYGDHVLETAASNLIPDLGAIQTAHRVKQSEPGIPEQLLTRIIGVELTGELHQEGVDFCDEVTRRWGSEALESVWAEPANLPIGGELTDQVAWAARVLLPDF
jgi:putative hydrolase